MFLGSPFKQLLAQMDFALVQLLLWRKVCREFSRISIADITLRWRRRSDLQARTALCVDCTNGGIAFWGSPFPQLFAHMYFASVQLLLWRKVCREYARISIADITLRWRMRSDLQTRTALCVDCTNGGIAFWGSPFPQLLAQMDFALVQLLLWRKVCREFARISIADITLRWRRRSDLQARTALCVDCTNGRITFMGSPFPQLLTHMYFGLVQLLFWRKVCREYARISNADITLRWRRRSDLQSRTALCVHCTNGGIAFLGSSIPQLLAHMYFALVQRLFWRKV